MSGDMPMWKGLFEWSMKYQDGTAPASHARPLPEQDRLWLEDALKGAMVDLSNRMQEIKDALDAAAATPPPTTAANAGTPAITEEPGVDTETRATSANANEELALRNAHVETPLEESERLLDELMELVESIDQARDLSTIGGLSTLLSLLSSRQPSLQWRAAEVAGVCVQNNPAVQAAFMDGGVLPALWPLLDHSHSTCRIKALLALSCMLRGYAPALRWFLGRQGVPKLIDMLSTALASTSNGANCAAAVDSDDDENGEGPTSPSGEEQRETETTTSVQGNTVSSSSSSSEVREQRKCLQMLNYVLHVAPMARESAAQHGQEALVRALAESMHSRDGDVRSAALATGLELARDEKCLNSMQRNRELIDAVQAVQCRLDALPKNEWPEVQEEVEKAKAFAQVLAKEVPISSVDGDGMSQQQQGTRDGHRDGDGNGNTNSMQMIALPEQQ